MTVTRFISKQSKILKHRNPFNRKLTPFINYASLHTTPSRHVQIDFEQIFDVDKTKQKKELKINYLDEKYQNWLLKDGKPPMDKLFLELYKGHDSSEKSPIEKHVDFLAKSYEFDKITCVMQKMGMMMMMSPF